MAAGARDGLDDETLQELRSQATRLLLKEDWAGYIGVCSRIVDGAATDRRVLCSALADCDAALAADPANPAALLAKGALLRGLGRYAPAADCFRAALPAGGGADEVRELLEQCRRLEAQVRSGAVDLSDWVLAGFSARCPDLAEHVGPVEVRRSAHGGRGVFAVKSVDFWLRGRGAEEKTTERRPSASATISERASRKLRRRDPRAAWAWRPCYSCWWWAPAPAS